MIMYNQVIQKKEDQGGNRDLEDFNVWSPFLVLRVRMIIITTRKINNLHQFLKIYLAMMKNKLN